MIQTLVLFAYFILAPPNTIACQLLDKIHLYPTVHQYTERVRNILAAEPWADTQGIKPHPREINSHLPIFADHTEFSFPGTLFKHLTWSSVNTQWSKRGSSAWFAWRFHKDESQLLWNGQSAYRDSGQWNKPSQIKIRLQAQQNI